MASASSRRTSLVVNGSAAAFSLHGHPRNGFRKASTVTFLFDSGARIANAARRREGRYRANEADLTMEPVVFNERSDAATALDGSLRIVPTVRSRGSGNPW